MTYKDIMMFSKLFDGTFFQKLILSVIGQIQSVSGQVILAVIACLTLSSFVILALRIVNIWYNRFRLKKFQKKWSVLTKNFDLQDDERIDEVADSISNKGTVNRLVRRMVLLRQKHSSFDYASFFENFLSQYSNKLFWIRWVLSILIILGLLGTVFGLSEAVNALHVEGNQTSEVLKIMIRDTMEGLGTAFNTTLYGILGMLLVSFCFYFFLAVRGRFLNKLDLFLQDSVVPVLFPNPQHVLMESYRLMTREFTKTQEAIKESNTGFIESLQKLSQEMMASYKSTFEDLKDQFTSLNKTTANLTRELAGNYETTQSILETIGQVATSFRQGTMNLEKSHTFIAKNYKKLFAEQERLEAMHQRQLKHLETNTEQLSKTLESSRFVNEKLSDLNQTMMKTQGSLQALSDETKKEKQTVIDLQKNFYSDLAKKREEELQKLNEAIGQNIGMIRQMEKDRQKNIDAQKTLVKELQKQHLENQQMLSEQARTERERMHQEQKKFLVELKNQNQEDHEALKRLSETISIDRKTELDQWTELNEKLHTELPAKITDAMERSGRKVNEDFRKTADKFALAVQDLDRTARFVTEQEKIIQQQWDHVQSNISELPGKLVHGFGEALNKQLKTMSEVLLESIKLAQLNTARTMTETQKKIAEEHRDFLIREVEKLKPSMDKLNNILTSFQTGINLQVKENAKTGRMVDQSFKTCVSNFNKSIQQNLENQKKFQQLIKQNMEIVNHIKKQTDSLDRKIDQINRTDSSRKINSHRPGYPYTERSKKQGGKERTKRKFRLWPFFKRREK